MAFFEFIEKLQQKPRRTRIKIMWLAVFISMLIIIGIWFWSFNSSTEIAGKDHHDLIVPEDLSQSIKQFKNDVPTLWQSLKAGMQNLEEE